MSDGQMTFTEAQEAPTTSSAKASRRSLRTSKKLQMPAEDSPTVAKKRKTADIPSSVPTINDDFISNIYDDIYKPSKPDYIKYHVSTYCLIGRNFKEEDVRSIPTYKALPYPEEFTRIVNELIRCAHRPEVFFNSLRAADDGVPSATVLFFDETEKSFKCKQIPVVKDFRSALDWFVEMLDSNGCCRTLFTEVLECNLSRCTQRDKSNMDGHLHKSNNPLYAPQGVVFNEVLGKGSVKEESFMGRSDWMNETESAENWNEDQSKKYINL